MLLDEFCLKFDSDVHPRVADLSSALAARCRTFPVECYGAIPSVRGGGVCECLVHGFRQGVLSGIAMAAEGAVADVGRRNSVSLGFSQRELVRVEPEDSVPVGALANGALDIGREISARLVHAFRGSRR